MRKPTYSQVVSTLALFLALGGSAYAAATITGSSVRDGSLTGKDVRNSSLTGKDVRDRSLRALDFREGELPAGPAGPAGPQGERGAKGETGERGPSTAVTDFNPFKVLPPNVLVNVLAVDLPAGSWVLTATGHLDHDGPAGQIAAAQCEIVIGGDAVSASSTSLGASGQPAEHASVATTFATTSSSPQRVDFVCDRTGSAPVQMRDASLTAIQVGSLDNTN